MDGFIDCFRPLAANRPFALAIAGSDWAYPFVQATHFTGYRFGLVPMSLLISVF